MRPSRLVVALLAALAGVTHAAAQSYPSRPVTLVVPFSAGGPTDTVARILAEPMGRSLGQTVVVEPVTGAAGTIGVGASCAPRPTATRSASATGAPMW